MKKWKAVLLSMGLSAASAAVGIYVPKTYQPLVLAAVAPLIGAAGIAAKKTSEANPDGTPAEQPWLKV